MTDKFLMWFYVADSLPSKLKAMEMDHCQLLLHFRTPCLNMLCLIRRSEQTLMNYTLVVCFLQQKGVCRSLLQNCAHGVPWVWINRAEIMEENIEASDQNNSNTTVFFYIIH